MKTAAAFHDDAAGAPALASRSIDQLADAHRLSRATMYREVKAGRLRVMKVGRATRVSAQAEQDWVNLCESAVGNKPRRRSAAEA